MYQFIVMITGSLSSLIFTQMNHPLAMGMMLLIQTLIICLSTGLMTKGFWFSYILFLVFLGGLLVLFIYVTSLASNEMFSLSSKMILISGAPLIILMSVTLIMDPFNLISGQTTSDSVESTTYMTLNQEEANSSLMKLYNMPTSIITILLVIYLFLTLIAVVTITNIFHGPLREKN
uniref:NADH-ubiquinone oxidoreductase chain 6 n=1 Tax=Neuroperla schedingi TaxID=466754 RepID=A0A482JJL6_9NEOP|nr:NADH dehydrogenase subunit 6 [Neuroperla schedingi]QBP33905.1 NADH dehydrogenase subunit 6 [Neuroperla schedingi]